MAQFGGSGWGSIIAFRLRYKLRPSRYTGIHQMFVCGDSSGDIFSDSTVRNPCASDRPEGVGLES